MTFRLRTIILFTTIGTSWACPAAAADLAEDQARVEPITIGRTYIFRSRGLGADRNINVALPERCGQPGANCPVLILLDGGVKEDFLPIVGLVQALGNYGSGPRVVVVGVEGADRRHDLTSPSMRPEDIKAAPTSGGAEQYRRFLVEELQPWVKMRFGNTGRVAIMGESLAGLFVLETALKHPRSFDDYIAVSPSLWWNGGALLTDAPRALASGALAGHRLWIGFERPSPPAAEAARDLARQHDLALAVRKFHRRGDGRTATFSQDHQAVYLPAAIQGLNFVFAGQTPRK